jgi:hypothetical protein
VGGSQGTRPVAPGGGRCMRARELAVRRARGDALGEDARLLDAHLAGCGRCRDHAASLGGSASRGADPKAVVGGEAAPTGANVGAVEATPSQDPEQSHVPSRVDAMGRDKRRQVIGHAYAPTRTRQLTYYGIFVAIIVALFVGAKIAVDELDKAPENIEQTAPWSQDNAPQVPPQRFE